MGKSKMIVVFGILFILTSCQNVTLMHDNVTQNNPKKIEAKASSFPKSDCDSDMTMNDQEVDCYTSKTICSLPDGFYQDHPIEIVIEKPPSESGSSVFSSSFKMASSFIVYKKFIYFGLGIERFDCEKKMIEKIGGKKERVFGALTGMFNGKIFFYLHNFMEDRDSLTGANYIYDTSKNTFEEIDFYKFSGNEKLGKKDQLGSELCGGYEPVSEFEGDLYCIENIKNSTDVTYAVNLREKTIQR